MAGPSEHALLNDLAVHFAATSAICVDAAARAETDVDAKVHRACSCAWALAAELASQAAAGARPQGEARPSPTCAGLRIVGGTDVEGRAAHG